MIPLTPTIRTSRCNDRPERPDREYVLYWMVANRRTRWNFALQHAIWQAQRLRRPLVVLEALRVGYPWASVRHHRFILDGMADNARRFQGTTVTYVPYVEPAHRAGSGLLELLARSACMVVTDEFPCFFLPRMVAAAASKLDVALVQVDSNGILPLRAAERVFSTAASFRRFLQKVLSTHLKAIPEPDPLVRLELSGPARLSPLALERWPPAAPELLEGYEPSLLNRLPIDQSVSVVPYRGGSQAAERNWKRFLDSSLHRYAQERNHPDEEVESGLSPYLHFGQFSSHQVVAELLQREAWNDDRLPDRPTGSRLGWWGMSEPVEAFLDQLITWRELGFNFCFHRPHDYDTFRSLPAWALDTLARHAPDPRPYTCTLEELEAGQTHDRLWNATQMQLVQEGRIHNYLRMLWGKKILEWSEEPTQALDTMIQLNNRYAVDGRDPSSYNGICWILGRYDRPWGPERPIFGTVRYMSSVNTLRKVRMRRYLERFGTPL